MVDSSSIKVKKKIAIIAIIAQPQQTLRTESIARGLFNGVNFKMAHGTPISIKVGPLADGDTHSRSVTIESPNVINECLIKDFSFSIPKNLSYGDYLRWAFSSIGRFPMYFWYRLKQTVRNKPVYSQSKIEQFTEIVGRILASFFQAFGKFFPNFCGFLAS